MKKFALIVFGSDESYGMLFAGTEFKKHGDIKFFDGDDIDCISSIISYLPDYICFSPMTVNINQAVMMEKFIKSAIPVKSIYGGHHVTNATEQYGDLTIVGSVHGIDIEKTGRVYNGPTKATDLKVPAREEYFRDIPRMRDRYRKTILSVTGCPWNCSYCSSASENTRRVYGKVSCALEHRNIEDIIEEAKFIKDCTEDIEWVDDDILFGDQIWLMDFLVRWQEEIMLPMYVSTTSLSALKASDEILLKLRKSVNCVGLGVQAINPESLKLLGRAWDSKEQIKKAYDRLVSFGFRVNLQGIVGLPVEDPVEDAIQTILGVSEIGFGSIASFYPLQIYPGTKMERYCKEKGFKFNDYCEGNTNCGVPAIDFGKEINDKLAKITKLGMLVVKYGIDEKWFRALIESDKEVATMKYYECIKDRLPGRADEIFENIKQTTNIKY